MSFPVLLDACVLLPYQLCDLLLRVAESGLYRPLWSEDILDELAPSGSHPSRPATGSNRCGRRFPLPGFTTTATSHQPWSITLKIVTYWPPQFGVQPQSS